VFVIADGEQKPNRLTCTISTGEMPVPCIENLLFPGLDDQHKTLDFSLSEPGMGCTLVLGFTIEMGKSGILDQIEHPSARATARVAVLLFCSILVF
jgi:hypothetical protein